MRAEDAGLFTAALAVIPKFPSWSQPAADTVAEMVAEWCQTPQEAQTLVRAAISQLPEWTGIGALRAIHESLHNPDENVWRPPQTWEDYDPGPGEGRGCRDCTGTGAIIAHTDGRFRASVCKCSTNDQSAIRHVEALNRANDDMRRLRHRAEMKHRVPRATPAPPAAAPPPPGPAKPKVPEMEAMLQKFLAKRPPAREPGDESEQPEEKTARPRKPN